MCTLFDTNESHKFAHSTESNVVTTSIHHGARLVRETLFISRMLVNLCPYFGKNVKFFRLAFMQYFHEIQDIAHKSDMRFPSSTQYATILPINYVESTYTTPFQRMTRMAAWLWRMTHSLGVFEFLPEHHYSKNGERKSMCKSVCVCFMCKSNQSIISQPEFKS